MESRCHINTYLILERDIYIEIEGKRGKAVDVTVGGSFVSIVNHDCYRDRRIERQRF